MPIQITNVDFAVPTYATIGERFPSWQEAVDHACSSIKPARYAGQKLRKPEEYSASEPFHPRRYRQDGDTLVIDSRAFVQMRVVEPIQAREGSSVESGSDDVAMSWEVFSDGTVETL